MRDDPSALWFDAYIPTSFFPGKMGNISNTLAGCV